MKTTVSEKIEAFIEKHNMLSPYDTLILAVSGGADSMCMLHFFKEYSIKKNINIICAHVNHGIRGAEADSDEAFVAEFCKENNIPFRAAHYNVPEIAKQKGQSFEECGRRLRYEFFASINRNAKIATAHNLNDSMETVIFNLARGTSLKGLTGIPAVRGNIIRPVLCLTRNEIEQYNEFYGINYVTDSTNLSDDYARNKIRHNVIPVLTEINEGFANVFNGCTQSLEDIEDYLESSSEEAYIRICNNGRFSVVELMMLHKAVRDRVIIKICENAGAFDISRKHIELVNSILLSGGAVMLHGAVTVKCDGKYLYKTEHQVADVDIFVPVNNNVTLYHFPSVTIRLVDVDKSELNLYNRKTMSSEGFIDASLLCGAYFRSRNEGDRFKFPYAEHSKTLKNLYKEKNISSQSRVGVPMLANGDKILWINGVGVSDYGKVTPETEKIVRIIADGVKGECYE